MAASAVQRPHTQLRIYDLPIWAGDPEPFLDGVISGQGWKIGARKVSNDIGRSEEFFERMRGLYPRYSTHSIGRNGTWWVAPQLFVEAKSRVLAQRVLNLLLSCSVVLSGDLSFYEEEFIALPNDRSQQEDLDDIEMRIACERTRYLRDALPASELSAKASRNRSLTYAVFKLKASLALCSAPLMSFHPFYSPKKFYVDRDPQAHVAMGSAITLAYSAIEELQLEPRPKGEKAIKSKDGIWDPVAFQDLNKRLADSNIDLDEKLSWNVRGSPTRIHRHPRFPRGLKESWAGGPVRDESVSISDALLIASWLRSKCTTHRFQKETTSITMFDVQNVQQLARRLLLQRTRLWRYWERFENASNVPINAESVSEGPA